MIYGDRKDEICLDIVGTMVKKSNVSRIRRLI